MHVTLIAAQSVDGFITRHDQPGSDFTSPADKVHFRKALQEFDCRVMGATTYRTMRDIIRRTASPDHFQVVLSREPAKFEGESIPQALEFSDSPPGPLLDELRRRAHRRCALIGGSQVHSLFLAANCVDELWLTIEPVLFGRGTPLLSKETDTSLTLLSQQLLSENTLLLKYRVHSKTGARTTEPH